MKNLFGSESSWVRITSIGIDHIKNVDHGEITLSSRKDSFGSCVLGLYGQNGSGKTAIINVLSILSLILRKQSLPEKTTGLIMKGEKKAHLKICFQIHNGDDLYTVEYEFTLASSIDEGSKTERPTIENEVLKVALASEDKNMKMTTMINTSSEAVFSPKTKLEELVGTDDKTILDLLVARRLAYAQSQSFIFSTPLLNAIEQNGSPLSLLVSSTISRLLHFGAEEFVVSTTEDTALLVSGEMNLYLMGGGIQHVTVSTEHPFTIDSADFPAIKSSIGNMSRVLSALVPGLSLQLADFGQEIGKDGNLCNRVQLLSRRDGTVIPLHYESEGIRKIVSILNLFIRVFNCRSWTVAIDELDSGIFEYILGEVLRIISNQGKGQLIFTSHNLRPLETLDKSEIVFTTVNPKNRYIRLKNIMATNNLRDCYYRRIVTESGSDALYEYTDNAQLAYALRKAGSSVS